MGERKSMVERPESVLLEHFSEEKLANGGLVEPLGPFPGSRSKGDSDSGSTSASESMDLTISLSADMALNRESGSISLKVRVVPRGCWGMWRREEPFPRESFAGLAFCVACPSWAQASRALSAGLSCARGMWHLLR